MRFAILGLLLLVGLLTAGVAGFIVADVTLEELRDVVIIVYGATAILLLVVMIIAVLGLWLAVRMLTRTLRDLLDDPVRPALDEIRATARNVRRSSEFIADAAVHPLIRVLAVGRGIRRGLGLVTGITRRRR